MKYFLGLCCCLFLLGMSPVFSQYLNLKPTTIDTPPLIQKDLFMKTPKTTYRTWQRAVAAPVILIGAGLYSFTDNEWLNKYEVKEERDEWMPNFPHHLDDYIQFETINFHA